MAIIFERGDDRVFGRHDGAGDIAERCYVRE
jgi:hypothetical protein